MAVMVSRAPSWTDCPLKGAGSGSALRSNLRWVLNAARATSRTHPEPCTRGAWFLGNSSTHLRSLRQIHTPPAVCRWRRSSSAQRNCALRHAGAELLQFRPAPRGSCVFLSDDLLGKKTPGCHFASSGPDLRCNTFVLL